MEKIRKNFGFGCMRLPMIGEDVDIEQTKQMVDCFLEQGFNYFDTAHGYLQGKSELALKECLSSRYPREDYVLTNKLSGSYFKKEEDIRPFFESQLAACGVDYFDFYLMHSQSTTNYQHYRDCRAYETAFALKAEGKVRHVGISFHDRAAVLEQILTDYPAIEVVQIQLNYLDWNHATPGNVNAQYLYGELCKRGIPSIIMEPLLGGRLSNVPDRIAARLKEQDPESSVASWAFRFAGTPDMILTVLSGMTYMEHLQDNIRTYSPLVPLTEEDKAFLEETAHQMHEYPTIPCNDCQYCMPCPYGIDIPGVLLHYNKCVNEGNLSASSSDSNYREARRAFLVGYDRSVPKLRQADHCIGCGQCNEHCPQAIDIPKEMQRINDYVEKLKQGTL